ncbi:polysaccharide biosynthesis C-terminal domain-containing protein [Bacteroidia bacterium]|nr:polysaccharide biosynthesis C-terminal domain-containing protein [Bacteroidia bacterium]
MGVIERQSLKASVVNYAGALIGILNTFFLFTLCFDESELGQIRYIQEVAMLMASFSSLGIFNVVIRFFPDFKTEDNRNRGILTFSIGVVVIGLGILALILFYFHAYLSDNILSNRLVIFIVAAAIVFGSLGYSYSSNFGLVTVPSLFKNLYVKLTVAIFGLTYFYEVFDFDWMLNSLGLVYLSSTFFILLYLWKKGNFKLLFNFSFFTREKINKIAVFAGFGILGTLGSGLANRIDIFMVSDILNFSRTGVYTIALNASNLLMIPTAGILAVSGPVIVSALARDDIQEVETIYKKAGVNLFLFGCLILLLLWTNVDALFKLIPNGERYESGKIVILILGVAKLFDMLTSVNELIISYSKYYKFNLIALLALAVLNIAANIIFIPEFNITGAALATFMSVVLYNILKTIYIYRKFGIHPFQIKLILIFSLSMCLYGVNWFLPEISNPFLSIVSKTIILGSIFVFFSLKFQLSEEATKIWNQTKMRISSIFNK